jgi:hypothetical protein
MAAGDAPLHTVWAAVKVLFAMLVMVRVAAVLVAAGQLLLTTRRYWLPVIPAVTPVRVSVPVVAPEYIPPLVMGTLFSVHWKVMGARPMPFAVKLTLPPAQLETEAGFAVMVLGGLTVIVTVWAAVAAQTGVVLLVGVTWYTTF